MKKLKNKCLKAMNILKVLSRTSWGRDRKYLINLYKSLIHMRLDYGAIIYQTATTTALKMLVWFIIWASVILWMLFALVS